MRIVSIPAGELTDRQIDAWIKVQSSNLALDSPFFRPEFAQSVARFVGGVEVGVATDATAPAAFFPFRRRAKNIGGAVPLCEIQGLISRPDLELDAKQLVHECGLSAWHFDQVVAAQRVFQRHHWVHGASPFIDTSSGFDAYRAAVRRGRNKTIAKTLRKLRRWERDTCGIRFELQSRDASILQSLIDWKTRQCARTGMFNVFSRGWTRQLFKNLLDESNPAFHGVMSVLFVQDEPQAVIYGLRSGGVLHTWASAHRPDFARYSPGYQLLLALAQAAPDLGIARIDLSQGCRERYKESFMSGYIPLAAGSVDARPTRLLRYSWSRLHGQLRRSRFRQTLIAPWRWVQRAVRQAQFPL